MLRFVLPFALLPIAGWADDIPVTSQVTEATLYAPFSAEILRTAPFTIPAGRHRLILTDVPLGSVQGAVRVTAEGAQVGAITIRSDARPTQGIEKSPEILAAEEEVEQLSAELRGAEDRIAEIQLRAEAADLQIAFLKSLGQGEDTPAADDVGAAVRQIGGDALAALQTARTARFEAGEAERALKDQRDALEKAERALKALVTEDLDRLYIEVNVAAEAQSTGVLEMRYVIDNAGWTPVYEIELTRGAPATLAVRRFAFLNQTTGENWEDVALTLSTTPATDRLAANSVFPWFRRIAPPPPAPSRQALQDESFGVGGLDEPLLEPAIILEEVGATVDPNGPNVSYVYGEPLDVASDADFVRIALGEGRTEPEIFGRATPMSNKTAFLTASFTNDTGEPVLPSNYVSLFVDGDFVGDTDTVLIAEGTDAELGFGPLRSVQVTRIVEDRNAGDRGVLSRSNIQSEAVRFEVENRGADPIAMRLRDRVPYSEQEDLEITWNASPHPTEENVDDRRGVLEWRFDLAPGASQAIDLSHELRWPDGQILQ